MVHLQRAQVLLEQSNYREAEKELRMVLAKEPNHPTALRQLAMVHIETHRAYKGVEIAERALEADPSDSVTHYTLAYGLIKCDKDAQAAKRVQEAIRLNPQESEYFALWCATSLSRKKYQSALEQANQALALNAENINALNLKAIAQRFLGDKAGAAESTFRVLERDPENSHSHANLGWAMLDKGKPKKALEHFREALRHQPDSEFAKSGLVEGLKARFWLYRIFLAYYLWMEKQSGGLQGLIIVGAYILTRFVKRTLDATPEYSPFLKPIFILLLAFAYSTWVISPLFNLILLLNPYGKYALTNEDRLGAKRAGSVLAIALAAGAINLWISSYGAWLTLFFYALFMVIPIAVLSRGSSLKWYRFFSIFTNALAIVGGMAVIMAFAINVPFNLFTAIFFIGMFCFQILANFVTIKG